MQKKSRFGKIVFWFLGILLIFRVSWGVLDGFMIDCPEGDICELWGKKVDFLAKVVSIESRRMEKTFLEVDVLKTESQEKVTKGKVLLMLPLAQYDYFFGDLVRVSGTLKQPSDFSESAFSYPLYLKGKQIYTNSFFPEVTIVKKSPDNFKDSVFCWILKKRERVREAIDRHFREPEASIVKAFVIGDQGLIPLEKRELFSKIGIVHILSVSGSHVTLLIFILLFIAKFLTGRRLFKVFLVILGVTFYLLLSGSPSCAFRSALMGIFAFLALNFNRKANFKRMFWFSLFFLLWLNPLSIISDMGFQLSFLAIFGLAYLYPFLEKSFIWGKQGPLVGFWKILSVSFSIEMAVSPLVFFYFGFFSLVASISNFLLLPLFSLLLPLGFLVVVLDLLAFFLVDFPIFYDFFFFLADFLAIISQMSLSLIEIVSRLIFKIPFSHFSGEIGLKTVLIFYFGLFVLAFFLNLVLKKLIIPKKLQQFSNVEFLEEFSRKEKPFVSKKLSYFKNKLNNFLLDPIACFFVALSSLLLFLSFSYFYQSQKPNRVIFLDVSEGDAILWDFPKFHLQILIDGGPGRRVLGKLGEVLPFYEKKIELVFLSHDHADHLEGVKSVFQRFEVKNLFLPKTPLGKSSQLFRDVFLSALKQKSNIFFEKRGMKLAFSTEKGDFFEAEFLTPFFDYGRNPLRNVNNESMVLKIKKPESALFPGDAEKGLMESLIFKNREDLPSRILKVPHHGSKTASLTDFFSFVSPEQSIISVGKNNQFGHPAKSTLDRLGEVGSEIKRTDLLGNIFFDFF